MIALIPNTTEPTLADRFYLSQGDRLGLVLSQHDPGRLQPIHHRLEALHDDEGRGCDRHAGLVLCDLLTVALLGSGFLSHLHSLAVTMSQKPSLIKST